LGRVLVLNPFKYCGKNLNLMVDPVVRRHAGQEVKTGLTYPLGLGYVASALAGAGCDVRMHDPMAEHVPVADIHADAEWADAIIVPYTFPHAEDIATFFASLPTKVRILCGPIAELRYEELLQHPFVDVVLLGEPERVVVELVQRYGDLSEIKGVAYRDGDGRIISNGYREFCDDLDTLAAPFRAFGNPRVYWDISFFGQPTAWVLPTRGCPYRCIFCAQSGEHSGPVRRRSPSNVVDEVEQIQRDYGINCITFSDETFNLDPSYVRAVCEEILNRKLRIEWQGTARADRVDADALKLMKRSGCVELQYGLESANDDILRYLKKGETVADIRRGLEMTRDAGINFSLYCVFGSPMENEQTVRNTMAFVRELRPLLVSFNVLTPLPGSLLYHDVEEDLRTKGDLTTFDILHTDYSLCDYSPEELSQIIRKAYRTYYLSPRFAGRLLLECLKRPKLFYWMMLKAIPKEARYVFGSILLRRD